MVVYAPGRTSGYPQVPPERGLRYHYLGGGNEVGNVGIVLEDQHQIDFCLITELLQQNHHDIQMKHHMFLMPSLRIHTSII